MSFFISHVSFLPWSLIFDIAYCKFIFTEWQIVAEFLSVFMSVFFCLIGANIFSIIFLSLIISPSEFDSSTIFFISVTRPFILVILPFSLRFLYLLNNSLIWINKLLHKRL